LTNCLSLLTIPTKYKQISTKQKIKLTGTAQAIMRYPKLRLTKARITGAIVALTLLTQGLVPFLVPSASAGTLTNTLVRFDRLAQAQATTGTVCAKPATSATVAEVSVTFPTGFTVSSTVGNWTVSTATTTGWPTGGTAWPGIAAPTGSGNFTISGQTVNFGSSTLTVGTLYCFNWTNTAALTTGTAAAYTGSVSTQTATPTVVDTGDYATTIVGANADQIAVTATVNPTFSMALSANTDALGALSTGSVSVSPTPRTATVNTNANNGWYFWGKDSSAGLNSVIATHTIASNCSGGVGSNSTLSAGTEGYNIGAVATSQVGGTGTVSIPAIFTGGSTGKGGGLCSSNYQTVASSSGTAETSVVTLTNNAAISSLTPPGTDYSDTETFVGAGLF
jgi:hypothetical protein